MAAAGGWQLAVDAWAGRVDDRVPMQARLHSGSIFNCVDARAVQGRLAGWLAVRSAVRAQQHAHAMAGHCEEQTSTARTKHANSAGPGKEVAAADPIDIDRGTELPRPGRCRPTGPGISSCRLAQQGARLPTLVRSCRTVAVYPHRYVQ